MSDETTLVEGAGAAAPAEVTDAPAIEPTEGATPEAQAAEAAQAEAAKKADEEQQRKKNRTREYINRINRENAELRQRMAEFEAKAKAPATSDAEPKLEDFNFDIGAFNRAHTEYVLKQHQEQQSKADQARREAETAATYNEKVAEFVGDHPDFPEVVNSIAYPLSPAIEAAIMAHELGPQIAYFLGSDDDAAFQLAAVQPHLAAAAVQRIASRLTAAHQAPQAQPTPKPVTKAPAPVPTVSTRAPAETPPEKLTDDEWFKRRRKQG
jgi:uncharacterized FlaG/YvyC family protein